MSVLLFLFIYKKTAPLAFIPRIEGRVIQNAEPIRELDQPKLPTNTRSFQIDTIDFPDNYVLTHRTLGPVAFGENYFIEFEGTFQASKGQIYTFSVESDDGFRLLIDGKIVSEHTTPRPVGLTQGNFFLNKGAHHFQLSYFQTVGNAALTAKYQIRGGNNEYLLGESSNEVKFEEIKR